MLATHGKDAFLPAIPQPESGLTAEIMIKRARDLRPLLREAQAGLEARGDVSDEMNARLIEAGFYRVLQPRAFGGYECDMTEYLRLVMEVARGCPETGWVLSLTAGHQYQLASFPLDGLRQIFATTGEVRAPEVTAPPGEARRVPGGFRISGTWDYGSGSSHATHLLVVAKILEEGDGGEVQAIMAIVDRADFTIVRNWNVIGMQGTGSNRVVVEDLFVPECRTKPMFTHDGARIVPEPDRSVYANPLYHGQWRPFVVAESTAVIVGAAEGALDIYEEILTGRKTMFPVVAYRSEFAEFQINLGRCRALVDTARAALLEVAADYMRRSEAAERGEMPFDDETQHRMVLVEQQAIHLAWEAMDIMFRTAGSSAARKDAPLGRYWRNIGVMRGHLAHQSDSSAIAYARARLKIDSPQI